MRRGFLGHSTLRATTATAASQPVATGARVYLRRLSPDDEEPFLALGRDSRTLHRPWTYPPERPDQFRELLARTRRDDCECLLVCLHDTGSIAGVFTVSQIVRASFQSAYLGYYAHEHHSRQGLMRDGLELVLNHAFGRLGLHRLEANIQPGNAPSIALARGAGFRLEGFSPRYLLIGGRWRDHERYAITAEEHARRRG
jgi:[ribosomal protein S5]-alanine N-acetyltransferase